MKKKSIVAKNSIQGIATALQLSPATISRVLNNHPHVHETTRTKVLAMVEKQGFRRNTMAAGLRTNKTFTVGFIVPRISMYVHAEIISHVQNALYAKGYKVSIWQTNDSVEMEKELIQNLLASRVDAVIASCSLYTSDFDHFDLLVKNNIPVVFYDRVPLKPYPACIIKGDDYRGGYLGTSHLIELGCKRIAYISGPLVCSLYKERLAGFRNAMHQYKVPVIEDLIFYQELNVENARKCMHRLFAKKPYPDGIFATNDTTALAALEFAKERGTAVPGELKIVGYSNDPRTSITTPSVTTIEQFPQQIGNTIVNELWKILNKDESQIALDASPIVTPVELIRRLST